MYQALYRKYRPRTFDDVYGQKAITTTLKNELENGKPSHAYLFTGLRGSGKTTCSKIIAKAVNCLQPKGGNPCCECEICTGIDNDSVTDVMEIDAASNSGVDYIRELREQAFYQPVQCKKRVYIIDEVHMLSTEAFNALLKIMEEPPEHVLFILATTEVHKVPATIISRCQRFDFKRIDPEDIADRLSYIASQEGFSIERDAALMIARLADGGMRDAISLLDQCWSHSAAIDLKTVADCAGLSSSDMLFAISDAIAGGDCAAALLALSGAAGGSADIARLCEQLVGHFRNLMIARCTDKLSSLVVCLPQELERFNQSAAAFAVPRLLFILDCLQDTLARMGRTPNKRLELEMTLVRICESPSPAALAPAASVPPVAADGALAARLAKLEAALQGGSAPSASPAAPEAQDEAPKKSVLPPEELRKRAVPFPRWAEVLEKLKEKNRALYGALIGSNAYLADDLILIDSKNELFLKLIRENEYSKQNIHECIIEITGKKHRLGPFKEGHYKIEEGADPLDELLKNANELDIDLKVSE